MVGASLPEIGAEPFRLCSDFKRLSFEQWCPKLKSSHTARARHVVDTLIAIFTMQPNLDVGREREKLHISRIAKTRQASV